MKMCIAKMTYDSIKSFAVILPAIYPFGPSVENKKLYKNTTDMRESFIPLHVKKRI